MKNGMFSLIFVFCAFGEISCFLRKPFVLKVPLRKSLHLHSKGEYTSATSLAATRYDYVKSELHNSNFDEGLKLPSGIDSF
jgi:hypothetical protein